MTAEQNSAPHLTTAWIYRHRPMVRLTHWINVLCLTVLVMSGLQIFNAHPALYWGERSDPDKALFSLTAMRDASGSITGVTRVLNHAFDTTGILGASRDNAGELQRRGFPAWATLPGMQWLAMSRRWHLFFAWLFVANGLLFLLYAVISRHLANDLIPWWQDLRGIGRSLLDHILFRHPKGEAARHYNVLQKITYTLVIFGLGPLIVLTGLTMSPMMDATFPQLLTLFDGRQSARTIHFITAFAFIAFVLIHVFMVVVSGVWNNMRSMITGWYEVSG